MSLVCVLFILVCLSISFQGQWLRIGQTYPLRLKEAARDHPGPRNRWLPRFCGSWVKPLTYRATVRSTGIIPDYKIKFIEMHLKLEKTNFARSILLNLSYLMLLTCFICLCIILCPWVAHGTKIITPSVFNMCLSCVCVIFPNSSILHIKK